MKNKLLRLLIMVSRYGLYGLLIQTIFLQIAIAFNSEAQKIRSIKEFSSEFQYRNAELYQVIEDIETRSDYRFVYYEVDIQKKHKFSLSKQRMSVADLLLQLSESYNLAFKQLNNTITIKPLGNESNRSSPKLEIVIQGVTITGKVKSSEDDSGLPGVNVIVKGTAHGTVTDVEGNYSIDVESGEATLVFSSVGYISQEVNVGTNSVIDISLENDVTSLEELVVVGYATKKAGELTGSISTVDADDIKDMVAVNATDALKGTTSGVNIIDASTPGGDPIIRVRGLGTTNNNDPLWIVDGVPNSRVNPDNIETISILKDASAQAIYGARAANGVILVTTKSGKKNQAAQVDLKVTRGISQNTNYYNLLNTQEYGELLWMEVANENGGTLPAGYSHPQYGSGPQPVIPNYIWPAGANDADHSLYDPMNNIIMQANKEGTDWLDEASQNGTYTEVSLGVNGGSNNTNYAFQVGYLKEDGILKYTSYERYNLRANVTSDVTKWLQVGTRLALTYSQDNGDQSNNAEGSVFGWIYRAQPIVPVYDVAGNYGGSRATATGNARSVLFRLDKNQWDQTQFMRATGNVFAKADIVEGLSFNTLFGFNYNTEQSRDLTYIEWAAAEREAINSYSQGNNQTIQWNWSNTLQYSNTFGAHEITALVGTEAIENNYRTNSAGRQGYFLLNPDFFQLDAGTVNQTNSGNLSEPLIIDF
jgi:TonB-linked SusC/RagA family outer membrane protein